MKRLLIVTLLLISTSSNAGYVNIMCNDGFNQASAGNVFVGNYQQTIWLGSHFFNLKDYVWQ